MKSKRFASSLIALALASCAGLAQADNVSFSGFSHGSQTVTVTLSGPNAAVSKAVSAGGFNTVLNGGPSFESYCVDLYQTIAFGTPYSDYANVGAGHVFTNANANADIGRLYATAGVVDTAVEEAAFQIAVWEIAYEATGAGYNLGSGAATFSGGTAASSGALTLASTWLSGLAGNGPAVSVLESREHQDVVYAPIPEPETVLLMAVGLLGVATAARKKAKARA